jgi:Peptidogalycan biosysnthesis/recognition
MNNPLKALVYKNVNDLPTQVWGELLADASVAMSLQFWRVLEQARLNDFEYRYVLFVDEAGQVLGLTCFYSVTTDLAIFAPGSLRSLLNGVRRAFPNFLKLRMLECGTPITITSPPFARRANVTDTEMVAALHDVLHQNARAEGQLLIVVRDFEPNAHALEHEFHRHGYHWIDSLPNTYINIEWTTPDQYLSAMRSYYRSKFLKHLKRNQAAGISHRLADDFHDLAETLHAQWMIVHDSAKEFQREVLTPEFYRRFSQEMGSLSKAILFYREETLVGHALLLVDGETVRWLYVGREVAGNDGLYLYVAQTVVETAILLGAKRLEMGLTTYQIKQDLGAEVTPIKLALRATWGLINPFVGLGYKLLNSVPKPGPRQIFKAAKQPS